jgi:hypothetical protein
LSFGLFRISDIVLDMLSLEADSLSDERLWLLSRRADFWLASGGASIGLLASVLLITWHGDRELDALDFVLSEFHLGATYTAIVHRRLWRHCKADVLVVPLIILALTYALSMSGQAFLLTSIAMYAAVWHRGRQSLGVARFYQRQTGGPVSKTHDRLFRGAIYLPMLAATLAYTHLAAGDYEGKPYFAVSVGGGMTSMLGFGAAVWMGAYLAWALPRSGERLMITGQHSAPQVHPGEWWAVLAHAVAFGSGYVLGATNASFLLVLAVHHEVQYLYFAYAMFRRPGNFLAMSGSGMDRALSGSDSKASIRRGGTFRSEAGRGASFLVWPVIGFSGALAGGWSGLEWLAPLGMGGLFCHYWLDGRIWTRGARDA